MGLERGVALPFILLQANIPLKELDVPRLTGQGLTLKEGRGRRS